MVNWPRFVELISRSRRVVITSHVRPDCDALGSELAIAGVLAALGKETLICNAFAVPPNLRWIDPEGQLRQLGVSATAEDVNQCDTLLIVDTSAWVQLGTMGDVIRAFPGTKMVLDHHLSQDELGDEIFKDTNAEATGRLVVDAADQLGVTLTAAIARPAFMALATDTGWFRFSSTGPGTLRTAARLLEAGARPDDIYRDLYETDTLGRLRLIGRTLAKAQTELDGRLIYSSIERADFEAAGALPSDSEDIINMTLGVNGTRVAVLFVEQTSGGFKISFRSRSDLDCSKLAEFFGGGGHRKAAGALLKEPLDIVRAKVLDAVRAAMR